MIVFPFDRSDIINFRDPFLKLVSNVLIFNDKLSDIFLETISQYMKTVLEGNNITKDLPELEKIIRSSTNNIFNVKFREEDFVNTISDIVSSYAYLAKMLAFGQVYQNFANLWAIGNNNFIEPMRDTFWRTPSYEIGHLEKYSLFRYDRTSYNNSNGISATPTVTTPIVMVYAFINRHYILDLLPEISIVKNLLKQGFDIYATDWGTPSAYDKDLTIGHFVNNYLDKSVDLMREITKTDKVTLFGYCWGGDLALIMPHSILRR